MNIFVIPNSIAILFCNNLKINSFSMSFVLHFNIAHIGLQYSSFCAAIWALLHRQRGCIVKRIESCKDIFLVWINNSSFGFVTIRSEFIAVKGKAIPLCSIKQTV